MDTEYRELQGVINRLKQSATHNGRLDQSQFDNWMAKLAATVDGYFDRHRYGELSLQGHGVTREQLDLLYEAIERLQGAWWRERIMDFICGGGAQAEVIKLPPSQGRPL